eukprot:scaffold244993_cov28-Tisochrysis_lutea.AAC.2
MPFPIRSTAAVHVRERCAAPSFLFCVCRSPRLLGRRLARPIEPSESPVLVQRHRSRKGQRVSLRKSRCRRQAASFASGGRAGT